MAVYKVKGTLTIPSSTGMSAVDETEFRAIMYAATGSFGSPAVKSLYQDGDIIDYPVVSVDQAGNTSVDSVMSITYTLKDETTQDLFFHGDTSYKALTDSYKEALAAYGLVLTAEKITE